MLRKAGKLPSAVAVPDIAATVQIDLTGHSNSLIYRRSLQRLRSGNKAAMGSSEREQSGLAAVLHRPMLQSLSTILRSACIRCPCAAPGHAFKRSSCPAHLGSLGPLFAKFLLFFAKIDIALTMLAAQHSPAFLDWTAEVIPAALRAAFVECSAEPEARYSLDKLQVRLASIHVRMLLTN